MKINKSPLVIANYSAENKVPLEIIVEAKSKTAFISIKGNIYNWRNSSAEFEAKIKDATKKGATDAEIYINSGGGDVFEANEMLNLIEDNFKSVKVRLGALCASAGTVFPAKYYTSAKRNTKIMLHKPSAGAFGNEDKIESTLKLLKDITSDYKKLYAKKMSLSEKEVENLWAKGDYWLTAKEALKKGLIDEIEDAEAPIDAQTQMQLVACGAPNIQNQNSKNNKMDKLKLIALLGLDANATDEQIEAAIKENRIAASEKAKLEATLEKSTKEAKEAKVKALLDQAEKEKKIKPEQRASFEALANADFDNAKKVIEALTPINAISEQLEGKAGNGTDASKSGWTFADYQEKDPKAFKELPQEKQDALIEAHYKEQ